MALQKYFSIFLVFLACLSCYSYAYQFHVGGKDGWVTNPSENYNHWAERMRFQVNDTLYFKYNKGSDSVLEVNKDDYNKCQTDKPIKKMDDGKSVFKFDKSGPFYFISGNKQNCENGQKIIIVVLAVRNKPTPPKAATPSPATQPPATTSPPQAATPGPAASQPPASPAPSPHKSSAVSTFNPTVTFVWAVSLVISVAYLF